MPVKRSDYPKDWKQIALRVKTQAKWTCQQCGRPCKRPDESWDEFKFRLARRSKDLYLECCNKKIRFVLTTAHLDHNTQNNSPSNLRAMCSVCHLRYDAKHHATNAAKTRAKKKTATKPKKTAVITKTKPKSKTTTPRRKRTNDK